MGWFSYGIGWFSKGVEWGSGCFSLGFPVGSSRLKFFGEGFSRAPSGERLLGSLGLGFFGEEFSGLLVCEVFLIFSLCFFELALDGGLQGISFLL